MPSINTLINPNSDEVNKRLQMEREQQALDSQSLQGPDLIDLAKASAKSAYVNGVGFKAVGRLFNDPEVNYNEDQLKELYPDAPEGYFKGGASAYQAEMLYDKFKKQQNVEMIKTLIYGQEDKSSPDWWVVGRKGRNWVPALTGLATGFADPVTIPAMLLGGAATEAALPMAAKFAPEVTKRVAMAIGTSRLASNWFPEVLQNLAFEASSNYGIGKLNKDFTKEDPTLKDAVVNSIGTALLFGTASSVLRGYNVNFLRDSAMHISESIQKGFKFKGNIASMAMDSAVHNTHVLQEIVKDYVTNPSNSAENTLEKIAKRSQNYTGPEGFDTSGAKHVAVVDPLGNTLYTGERHGDNFIFVDDPKVAQGMVNEYNINGENKLQVVTSDKLNMEQFKLLDTSTELADNHPEILNVIESHFGSIADLGLQKDATVGDVFKAINNSAVDGSVSGSDINAMYRDVNTLLEQKGFDGLKTKVELDGKVHNTTEIFPSKLEDITHLGEAPSTEVPRITTDPLNENINLVNGESIQVDPVLHDPMLELDDDFKTSYAKDNDPEFLKKIIVDDFNKFVEEDVKLKEENLKEDIHADNMLNIDRVNPTKEESLINDKLEKAKEEYKADAPEKANEAFKVLENCKGKQ